MEGIEASSIVKLIVYTLLWICSAAAVAGLYIFVNNNKLKQDYKMRHDETYDSQRIALKLVMRDRLCDLLVDYREQGYVSETQFTDATEHYETYKKLYGNSFGDSIYGEIRELYRKGRQ